MSKNAFFNAASLGLILLLSGSSSLKAKSCDFVKQACINKCDKDSNCQEGCRDTSTKCKSMIANYVKLIQADNCILDCPTSSYKKGCDTFNSLCKQYAPIDSVNDPSPQPE